MAALAAVCLARPAFSIDPNRMLSQYIRDHWGVEQGFTGGSVTSFAQTNDGYLWIGTEKGLIRFDGLSFHLFQQAGPTAFPIGAVRQLMTDAQGNLWILLGSTKVLRYRDGRFELGREEVEFGITSVGRRGSGTVLFSSLTLGVLTNRVGKFEVLTSPGDRAPSEGTATTEGDNRSTRLSWAPHLVPHRLEPSSVVISMAESTDGRVWLGTQDKGLFYMSEGRIFAAGKGQSNTTINCLLVLENRELWIGTDRGILRWNGAEVTSVGVPSSLRHIHVLSMIRDRDSNIWVGTAHGLIRVNSDGVSVDGQSSWTSGAVTAIFEDREGNLWIGSARGLERLRNSAFVTYSAPGLKLQSMGALYVDPEDKTWFAPSEGGLRWWKRGKGGVVSAAGLSQDIIYSISGIGKNELWVGRRWGGLTHLSNVNGSITARTFTKSDGLPQNGVYAVHQNRDGSVWSATLNGGVSEYKNGRFTTYTTANGLASNTVSSIAEAADGTMWFGTPNGLSGLTKNGWRTFSVHNGLSSQDVYCLFPDATGILWIGTSEGLAFLNAGHIYVPRRVPDSLGEAVFGMAEDRDGILWVATSNHILQVKRKALIEDALTETDVREYGLADGLSGTEGVKRYQSVAMDSRGRVWFSTNRGLSVVDPEQAVATSAPALVHIEGVSADGTALDLGGPIHIPPGTRRTTVRYLGLSLSNSERVRYRYRLDGFDRGWSEGSTSQEATYNNLSVGKYQFRVMASNSDGLWNGSGATVGFDVEPSLWQTWWFLLGCAVCAGLVALLMYRLRMRQLTQLLKVGFEERLAERTRIARDIHDTLLQGVQGLVLHFHVAAQELPKGSTTRASMERALATADQILVQGRNHITRLRADDLTPSDLTDAFEAVAADLNYEQQVRFALGIEGRVEDVTSPVLHELYYIGREAISNAFRHSKASEIAVNLNCGSKSVVLIVTDDGRGFDPVAQEARPRTGHWGLQGMRERAETVGARFECQSSDTKGTKVIVTVPARRAYEKRSVPTYGRKRALS